jgi:hypothetical protein
MADAAAIPTPNALTSRVATARFEAVYVALCAVVVLGGYIDGWAHRHLASTLETFFTPWHALLYGAYGATAAALFAAILAGRSTAGSWHVAIPRGYGWAAVGALAVGVGGVLDLAWHMMFGIEVSVEALLSPTHLLLAAGFVLMFAAPIRAHVASHATQVPWPAAAAVALVVADLMFITQFVNPFAEYYPSYDVDSGLVPGIAAILIQSAVIAGGLIVLASLGRLRPGMAGLPIVLPAVGIAVIADTEIVIGAAVIAAAALEIVVARSDGHVTSRDLRWAVPLTVAILWAAYEGILQLAFGLNWTAHVWAGAIALGAISAWLVVYVAGNRGRLANS